MAAARGGIGRLRAARPLWIAGGLLLAWLAFAALRPASLDDARFDDHLVSFLKLVEYALLVALILVGVRPAERQHAVAARFADGQVLREPPSQPQKTVRLAVRHAARRHRGAAAGRVAPHW